MNKQLASFAARLRETISNRQSAIDNRQFSELALELFALQFDCNPAYRKICEARQLTPRAVGHWTRIPFVPTSAFKELELSCIPRDERTAVFHSSGTTDQKPSRHFHSPESLAIYEASLWHWFKRHFNDSNEFIFLTPDSKAAPHSSLVHMFETVSREFFQESSRSGSLNQRTRGAATLSIGGNNVSLSPGERVGGRADETRTNLSLEAHEQEHPATAFYGNAAADGAWTIDFPVVVQKFESASATGSPLTILGTAFSFVHLLDFLSEKNLQFNLPTGSCVMETGGYKNRSRALPKAELHALITRHLGVSRDNIICEYGMSELSSQAYDSEIHPPSSILHPRIFRFPPWSRVQIISPETGSEVADGETGLIRILDLANVFSVAAIQTEDLGVRRGDNFELIGRAQLAEPRGCSLMTA